MSGRAGGTAGITFALVGVVSGFVAGYPSAEDTATFAVQLDQMAGRQSVGAALAMVAAVALLVFVVALARMIDVAGTGEASRDSNVVLGAGLATVVFALLGIGVQAAGVAAAQLDLAESSQAMLLLAERVGALSPTSAVLTAVVVWVTGGAASSQDRLPDWLAPVSRAVAVVLVVASMLSVLIDVVVASPAVALVVPWVVAVSVWMWRSEPRPALETPMP